MSRNNNKRREYYRRNRSAIRQRDNENARKNRDANPERYLKYQQRFKEKQSINKEKIASPGYTPSFSDNDVKLIKYQISATHG